MIKKTILIIYITVLFPMFAWASNCSDAGGTDCTKNGTIYTCTDARTECIQDAVADADTGDTINFPESGAATWSDSVTIDKCVIIDGNGTTLTSSGTLTNGFYHITGFSDTENNLRITDHVFVMDEDDTARGIFSNSVTVDKFRFDHNTMYEGSTQMEVGGLKGVIDNNTFYNAYRGILYSAGTRAQADASWIDMSAGTADALFLEDNKWIENADYPNAGFDQRIDTNNGGKLVIRYNEFDSDNQPLSVTMPNIQIHGNAAAGEDYGYWEASAVTRRGQSVVEIYGNTMHGKRIDFLAKIRGSANLIYNNTHTDDDGGVARIYMYEEEYSEVQFDPLRVAWPAEDQVHNSHIWGNTFDDGTPQSTSNIVIAPANANCVGNLDPFTFCTGEGDGTGDFDDDDAFIKLNRDFFLAAPASSGGKETFTSYNGASGTHPTDGDPYTDYGTMTFSSSGANAYYGYEPYGTLVNDRYYHPLRDDIPTGASQLGITETGISHQ